MNDIYKANILDHYQNPRNFGRLDKPELTDEEENTFCGDRIKMEIKLKDKSIEEIKFSGEGCAICIASASILTEEAKEMTVSQIIKLKTDNIIKLLGICPTPVRLKCMLLPLEVLQKTLAFVKMK